MLLGIFALWRAIRKHLDASGTLQRKDLGRLHGAILAQLQAAFDSLGQHLDVFWGWRQVLEVAAGVATAEQLLQQQVEQQEQKKQQERQQQQQQQQYGQYQRWAPARQFKSTHELAEAAAQLRDLSKELKHCMPKRLLLEQLFQAAPSAAAMDALLAATPAAQKAAARSSCTSALFAAQPSLLHMDALLAAVGEGERAAERGRCLHKLAAVFGSMSSSDQVREKLRMVYS